MSTNSHATKTITIAIAMASTLFIISAKVHLILFCRIVSAVIQMLCGNGKFLAYLNARLTGR